jgi:hypothetical protein
MLQDSISDFATIKKKKDKYEKILSYYTPESRYMKSLNIEGNIGVAEFSALSEPYLINASKHLNAVTALICYNQLSLSFYSTFFKNMDLKHEINDETIQNIYMLKQTSHYRKVINQNFFIGYIEHLTLRNRNGLVVVTNKYNFGDSAFYGEMLLAIDTRS